MAVHMNVKLFLPGLSRAVRHTHAHSLRAGWQGAGIECRAHASAGGGTRFVGLVNRASAPLTKMGKLFLSGHV